jgi:hypothetical protein
MRAIPGPEHCWSISRVGADEAEGHHVQSHVAEKSVSEMEEMFQWL